MTIVPLLFRGIVIPPASTHSQLLLILNSQSHISCQVGAVSLVPLDRASEPPRILRKVRYRPPLDVDGDWKHGSETYHIDAPARANSSLLPPLDNTRCRPRV